MTSGTNCEETERLPLGVSASATTQICHVPVAASPFALSSYLASDKSGAMSMFAGVEIPVGFHRNLTVILLLKSARREIRILSMSLPFLTMGTAGDSSSMEKGTASVTAVSFMNCPNWMPGILVSMAPKGPRYSAGAKGLGSKDSWWDIPPGRKMWMTLSATGWWRANFFVAALAREPKNCGRAMPTDPSRPTYRNSRREE